LPRPPDEVVGVVVGRQDYGEADRIVRILTPDRGRVAAMARGARRAGSRLAAVDVGARVRAGLRAGRGELATLVSAEVEDGRVRMRGALGPLAIGLYACELCGALAREHHAEPRLYGLLETALLLLDATTADPGDAFLAGLEAKALTFAGVGPVLDRCVACGRAPDPLMRFVAGGLAHDGCAEDEGLVVTLDWARAVEAARRAPLQDSLDRTLPQGPRDALYRAIVAQLGRPLGSRAVLDALA
jgi:DNA repair protein RecO (recombination protein O)